MRKVDFFKKVIDNSKHQAKRQFNIDSFPKIDGETNDYNRFIRAFDNMEDGDTLILNNQDYALSGDLIITKKINIKGQHVIWDYNDDRPKGTVLTGGGIVLETSWINIDTIGIYCPTNDNGFEAHSTTIHDVNINNCIVYARDHCFLFESYEGTVQNIKVTNCQSHKAIHGFISKGMDITFENCKAEDCTSYGFGIISDIMTSDNSKKGMAWNNRIIKCNAIRCHRGFTTYCRDASSISCEVSNKNNQFISCIAESCNIPYWFGEKDIPSNYLSIKACEMIINNCYAYNTIGDISFYFANINNSDIGLINGDKEINFDIVTNCKTLKNNETDIMKAQCIDFGLELDIDKVHIFDLHQYRAETTTTSDKIIFKGNYKGEITLCIRSIGGTFSFGGFADNFVVPNEVKTTLEWGKTQISKWVYHTGTNKWVCTSCIESNYI